MIIGLAIPDSSSPSESASSALASPKPHSSRSFAQYLDRAHSDAANADDAQLRPKQRTNNPGKPQPERPEALKTGTDQALAGKDSRPQQTSKLVIRRLAVRDEARVETRTQTNSATSNAENALEAAPQSAQSSIEEEQPSEPTAESPKNATKVQGEPSGQDATDHDPLARPDVAPLLIPQEVAPENPTSAIVALTITQSEALQEQAPEAANLIPQIARPSAGTLPEGRQSNEPAVAPQTSASLEQAPPRDSTRAPGPSGILDIAPESEEEISLADSGIAPESNPAFQAAPIGPGASWMTTTTSQESGFALNGIATNAAIEPPQGVASETGVGPQPELNPLSSSPSTLAPSSQAASPSSELNGSIVRLSLKFDPSRGAQKTNPEPTGGEALQPLAAESQGRVENHTKLDGSSPISFADDSQAADGSDSFQREKGTRDEARFKGPSTNRSINSPNSSGSDRAALAKLPSANKVDEIVGPIGHNSSTGEDIPPGASPPKSVGAQKEPPQEPKSIALETQNSNPAGAVPLASGGERTSAAGQSRALPTPTPASPHLAIENGLAKPLAASVNQLRIEIPIAGANGAPDEKLQIHFSQRNAGLNLGIQANNGDLNLELRDALPELLQKLKTGGWQPQSNDGLRTQTLEGTRKIDALHATDRPSGEAGSFGQSREFGSSAQANEKNGGRQSFGGNADTASRQQDNRRDRRGRQQIWNRSWDGLSGGI